MKKYLRKKIKIEENVFWRIEKTLIFAPLKLMVP
jgi:hypothetical protein